MQFRLRSPDDACTTTLSHRTRRQLAYGFDGSQSGQQEIKTGVGYTQHIKRPPSAPKFPQQTPPQNSNTLLIIHILQIMQKIQIPNTFHILIGVGDKLFGKVEIVVQPLAGVNAGDIQARGAIGQRRIEDEATDGGCENDNGRGPCGKHRVEAHALLGRYEAADTATDPTLSLTGGIIRRGCGGGRVERRHVENKLDQRTCHHGRGEVGRQVVVQETLTAHQPEGEIVGSPAQEQEPSAVVQTGTSARTPNYRAKKNTLVI